MRRSDARREVLARLGWAPLGIATPTSSPAQQQRVALARSLVYNLRSSSSTSRSPPRRQAARGGERMARELIEQLDWRPSA